MAKTNDYLENFIISADERGRENMSAVVENAKYKSERATLGKSILGREIDCYKIGNGDTKVLLTGAHHGMESITTNLLFSVIYALLSDFSQTQEFYNISRTLLFYKYSFYIVPCVNPDGVEMRIHGLENNPLYMRQLQMSDGQTQNWQANARGVDLNHNYDYRFYEYKQLEQEKGITPGRTLYSGEYPESEPESHIIANFVRSCDFSAIMSLHSQGEEIYSFGGRLSNRIAFKLSELTGYTHATPKGTAQYSGLCDYTGAMGIPSFTIEVGNKPNPQDEKELYPIFKKCARAIALFPTLL